MMTQIVPVDDHEQQPLREERSQDRDDGEIPDMCWIHAGSARGALSEKESEHHAKRRNSAKGRDEKAPM